MGPNNQWNCISSFNKLFEIGNSRARGIADNHSGGQMNHFCSVADHLFGNRLDIASGTISAIGISHNLQGFFFRILREPAHTFPHGPKTFSAPAGLVPDADNDSDLFHDSIASTGLWKCFMIHSHPGRIISHLRPDIRCDRQSPDIWPEGGKKQVDPHRTGFHSCPVPC